MEDKSVQIHEDLDRYALLAQRSFASFFFCVYLLIRGVFEFPTILQPVFASTFVDAILVKGGMATFYVLGIMARLAAPRSEPAYSIEGRSTFGHYLRKHLRVYLTALKLMLLAEAIIDIFYFF